MFLITQALQFMDKTSLNYANLFGYQDALNLKGQQFSYLSASKESDLSRTSHTDACGSGIRWVLLWTVSLRLAYWAISRSKGHGHQHLSLGCYRTASYSKQNLF